MLTIKYKWKPLETILLDITVKLEACFYNILNAMFLIKKDLKDVILIILNYSFY